MKFRTVLLVFLFIKLCILFTVLQETIESLSSDDHPMLFGTNDIFCFDLLLVIISSFSIIFSLVLIVFFAIGHNNLRKPYIIAAFCVNAVFIAPFFVSGIYLSFHDNKHLVLSNTMGKKFLKISDHVDRWMTQNISVNGTGRAMLQVDQETMDAYDYVEHIQKRYCCCGLDGPGYYGFDNETTALKESIPFTNSSDIRCPLVSSFQSRPCIDSHLHSCQDRVKTVHPVRIMMYSCTGTVLSVMFLIFSPFIYSQFELDRRYARSEYIRQWRRSIEQHVAESKMWALRSERMRSEKDAKSLNSIAKSESAKINENRSAPRF